MATTAFASDSALRPRDPTRAESALARIGLWSQGRESIARASDSALRPRDFTRAETALARIGAALARIGLWSYSLRHYYVRCSAYRCDAQATSESSDATHAARNALCRCTEHV